MESGINTLPREEANHQGDPNFSQISRSSKPNCSFYLSLGLALFESLTRLKFMPHLVDQVWGQINQIFSQTSSIQAQIKSEDKITTLSSLIKLLRKPENSTQQCLEWLCKYSNRNQQSVAEALIIGMKCIFCHIFSAETPSIINNDFPSDVQRYLRAFADSLKVHIIITNLNYTISANADGPLLCLFNLPDNTLAVSYHKEHIQLEQSLQQDCIDRFPFYISKRVEAQQESPQLIQLVQSLAKYIMNPAGDRRLDKSEIKRCSEFFPDLSSGYFKEMSDFLDKCTHQDSKIVLPKCGRPHCSECLFHNNLKLNPPVCDCGMPIDEELIQEIRGIKSQPGLPSVPPVNPPSVMDIPMNFPFNHHNPASASNPGVIPFANPPAVDSNSQGINNTQLKMPPYQNPVNTMNQGTPNMPVNMPNPNGFDLNQGGMNRMGSVPNATPQIGHHNPTEGQIPHRHSMPSRINQKECIMCRKKKDNENFESIKCSDHEICSECRALSYKNGNTSCPYCRREYSQLDLEMLQVFLIDFNHLLDNEPGANIGGGLFQCQLCGQMKRNKYNCIQKCLTCTDCSKDQCSFCLDSYKNYERCTVCYQTLDYAGVVHKECGHKVHTNCVYQTCRGCYYS